MKCSAHITKGKYILLELVEQFHKVKKKSCQKEIYRIFFFAAYPQHTNFMQIELQQKSHTFEVHTR